MFLYVMEAKTHLLLIIFLILCVNQVTLENKDNVSVCLVCGGEILSPSVSQFFVVIKHLSKATLDLLWLTVSGGHVGKSMAK
jgi:hypothetical protein